MLGLRAHRLVGQDVRAALAGEASAAAELSWTTFDQARPSVAHEQHAAVAGVQRGCLLHQAGRQTLFNPEVLSAKARLAGYTLAVCRDLFVHPFGTRNFAHGAPAEAATATAGAPSA